ncbi:hypothetical protein [Actinoplanes aureus]|uniref:Uncharacterized protein n=1 Tax=Actinoplanes aureus TaxID=2792083 RepID=A0A931CAV7_9ACTN|nr:hypothetical protein [Actinoplanes aureus]MBG0564572.1 hypothetical protein [Actinoplanes aureus]
MLPELAGKWRADAELIITEVVGVNDALDHAEATSVLEHTEFTYLDETEQARRDLRARSLLIDAGMGLMRALESVANDDALWDQLSADDRRAHEFAPMTFEKQMYLREICAHDIPAVLRSLGYPDPPPPPPAEIWATWMREPLTAVLAAPPDEGNLSRRAAEAQLQLRWFTKRFRWLLERAMTDRSAPQPVDSPVARRTLAAELNSALRPAIAVSIAAGVAGGVAGSIVGGPPGGVVGAQAGPLLVAGGVVLTETVKEFAKVMLQTIGLHTLAHPAATELPGDRREGQIRDRLRLLDKALHALDKCGPDDGARRERWEFIARREAFAVLEAAGHLPAIEQRAWDSVRSILDGIRGGDARAAKLELSRLGNLLGPWA